MAASIVVQEEGGVYEASSTGAMRVVGGASTLPESASATGMQAQTAAQAAAQREAERAWSTTPTRSTEWMKP